MSLWKKLYGGKEDHNRELPDFLRIGILNKAPISCGNAKHKKRRASSITTKAGLSIEQLVVDVNTLKALNKSNPQFHVEIHY